MGSLTRSIERKSAHDRASREATLSRALSAKEWRLRIDIEEKIAV